MTPDGDVPLPVSSGVDDPIDECGVMLYVECEFCCGLFPRETIRAHVKMGHTSDWRRQIGRHPKRRLFACTEVGVDEDFPFLDDQGPSSSAIVKIESPDDCDFAEHNSRSVTDPDDVDVDPDQRAALLRRLKRDSVATTPSLKPPKRKYTKRKRLAATAGFPSPVSTSVSDTSQSSSTANNNTALAGHPDLPSAYGTKVIASSEPLVFTLECNISNKMQMAEWMKQYSTMARSNWIIASQCQKARHMYYNRVYACRHSAHNKTKSSNLNFGCEARIQITITLNGPCEILVDARHNHLVHRFSHKQPTAETIATINSYYEQGMDSHQARCHLELVIQAREDYNPTMLDDSSLLPGQKKFLELYHKYLKQNPDKKKPYRDYHPFRYRHGIDTIGKEERLRLLQETARQFDQYYVAEGMTPKEALRHHEKQLRQRDGFKEEWLKDTAYLPTHRQAKYFWEKHRQYRLRTVRKLRTQTDYEPELENEDFVEEESVAAEPSESSQPPQKPD